MKSFILTLFLLGVSGVSYAKTPCSGCEQKQKLPCHTIKTDKGFESCSTKQDKFSKSGQDMDIKQWMPKRFEKQKPENHKDCQTKVC